MKMNASLFALAAAAMLTFEVNVHLLADPPTAPDQSAPAPLNKFYRLRKP